MPRFKVVELERAIKEYRDNLVCGDLTLFDACALASAIEAGIIDQHEECFWCHPENYAGMITAGYVIVQL